MINRLLYIFPTNRLGKNEILATDILIDILVKDLKISEIKIQEFTNYVPVNLESRLEVKSKVLEALPICFYSGNINNQNIKIIEYDEENSFEENYIAYNKKCKAISRHTFFKNASFAINRKNAKFVKNNIDYVKGFVEIQKFQYVSRNLLIGNTDNPQNVLFCHLDTVENGFIDNLSGVLCMLMLLIKDKKLLNKNLFVFSGNEELSYDFPIYWGYGYRKFEEEYFYLLEQSKKILILDCIGQTNLKIYKENIDILQLGFPIKNLKSLVNKTYMFSGNLNSLMKIYHSVIDTIDNIKLDLFFKTIDYIYSVIM
jgi:hypothetical protein